MRDTLFGLAYASDQAAALTGPAYLEHILEILLQASFRTLTADEKQRMFDGSSNGILGTMSSKIRVAFAMRLIEKEIYDDLKLINDIRNVFAHTLHEINFSHDLVKQDCENLKSYKPNGIANRPKDSKEKYIYTIINAYFSIRATVNKFTMAKALRNEPEA